MHIRITNNKPWDHKSMRIRFESNHSMEKNIIHATILHVNFFFYQECQFSGYFWLCQFAPIKNCTKQKLLIIINSRVHEMKFAFSFSIWLNLLVVQSLWPKYIRKVEEWIQLHTHESISLSLTLFADDATTIVDWATFISWVHWI